MNYKIIYSKDKKQFNNSSQVKHIPNMGNWRSRWERKRDLDKKKGVYINKIYTKATDKDYIVTSAYGFDTKNNMFFKIVPNSTAIKPTPQINNVISTTNNSKKLVRTITKPLKVKRKIVLNNSSIVKGQVNLNNPANGKGQIVLNTPTNIKGKIDSTKLCMDVNSKRCGKFCKHKK